MKTNNDNREYALENYSEYFNNETVADEIDSLVENCIYFYHNQKHDLLDPEIKEISKKYDFENLFMFIRGEAIELEDLFEIPNDIKRQELERLECILAVFFPDGINLGINKFTDFRFSDDLGVTVIKKSESDTIDDWIIIVKLPERLKAVDEEPNYLYENFLINGFKSSKESFIRLDDFENDSDIPDPRDHFMLLEDFNDKLEEFLKNYNPIKEKDIISFFNREKTKREKASIDFVYEELFWQKEQAFKERLYRRIEPTNDLNKLIELMEDPDSRVVVYDLETTGLDLVKNGIVQIAIIEAKTEEVLFKSYIKPDFLTQIDSKAMEINGITEDQLENAPTFDEVKDKIQEVFSSADLVIGYNNFRFDDHFLMANGISIDADEFDLMHELTPIVGIWSDYHCDFKWPKLSESADYFKVEIQGKEHDALTDCLTTARVLKQYISEL